MVQNQISNSNGAPYQAAPQYAPPPQQYAAAAPPYQQPYQAASPYQPPPPADWQQGRAKGGFCTSCGASKEGRFCGQCGRE